MNFLPIIERELRVTARRPKVRRGRLILTALATLIVGAIVEFLTGTIGARGAQMVFAGFCGVLFFGCFIAGAELTADCLSEEKREGTLGLLFLTPLHGFDIILGKLTASLLVPLYTLFGMAPVLSLLIIFGGIELGEFFRVMLFLVNTLFFSASAGMFVSSISRQRQRARTSTALLLVFWWLGLPVLSNILKTQSSGSSFGWWLGLLSPSQNLQGAFAGMGTASSRSFWLSFAFIHLFSWLFLGAASLILPIMWRDKPSSRPALVWKERLKQWTYGGQAIRTARRTRMLERNPLYWLALRNRFKALPMWLFLIVIFAITLSVAINSPNGPPFFISMFLLCNLVVKTSIAGAAAQFIAGEKASGALEWILSTPLLIEEVIAGQWLALRQLFLGPILLLVAIETSFLVAGRIYYAEPWSYWWVCGVGVILTFILDSIALAWVGMWSGISFKNIRRVSSVTLSQVLLLPAAIFLFLAGAVSFMNLHQFQKIDLSPWLAILSWFLLGIAVDIIWIYAARLKLKRRMRAMASPWVS